MDVLAAGALSVGLSKAGLTRTRRSPPSRAVVLGLLEQRRQLGLAPRFRVEQPDELVVVPVIAVQRGASGKLLARLWQVQQALLDAGVGDPALEVYQVSLSGRLDRLHA